MFIIKIAFAVYSKRSGNLAVEMNVVGISSERPHTWAFYLSCYMGFRQVPLNVDKLILSTFCVSQVGAWQEDSVFYLWLAH